MEGAAAHRYSGLDGVQLRGWGLWFYFFWQKVKYTFALRLSRGGECAPGGVRAAEGAAGDVGEPELDAGDRGRGAPRHAGRLVHACVRRAPLVPRQSAHPGGPQRGAGEYRVSGLGLQGTPRHTRAPPTRASCTLQLSCGVGRFVSGFQAFKGFQGAMVAFDATWKLWQYHPHACMDVDVLPLGVQHWRSCIWSKQAPRGPPRTSASRTPPQLRCACALHDADAPADN